MNRFLLSIGFVFLLVSTGSSQNPDDIKFTITTVNGRKMFRMGEAIPVGFHFSSTKEKTYEVHESFPRERVFYASPTRLVAEPADGVFDPLGDYVYQFPAAIGSAPPKVWPLDMKDVVNEHYLNEWLSFKKPGLYRIVAETSSVTLAGQGGVLNPRNPIHLRSNSIEIEIVAAENGWAESQLQLAIRAIEDANPFPRSVTIHPLGSIQSPVSLQASTVLRFLGTQGAARTLVRFISRSNVGEISSGLWASPQRKEVLAAMEASLIDPDFVVTVGWLDRLVWLAAGYKIGPRLSGDPQNPDPLYLGRLIDARTAPLKRYVPELSKALEHKRGPARDAAVNTLSAFEPTSR